MELSEHELMIQIKQCQTVRNMLRGYSKFAVERHEVEEAIQDLSLINSKLVFLGALEAIDALRISVNQSQNFVDYIKDFVPADEEF